MQTKNGSAPRSEWYRMPDLNPQGKTVNLDYVWKIKISNQLLISSRTKKSEVKNISEMET